MTATQTAFDTARLAIGAPRLPPEERILNADQLKLMTVADGLLHWVDGEAQPRAPSTCAPILDQQSCAGRHLWVVRNADVVHAEERCKFGKALESQVIKHTNLTGGEAAFAGGELIQLDATTIVVNGCSGRYGPRTDAELQLCARAFAESGYGVWCMGWDEDTDYPAPFLGSIPQRLS